MEKQNQSANNKKNQSDVKLNQIKNHYIHDFIQEIYETLDSIELGLVNLEVDPDNTEFLNAVYCNFHTLKGLTGFLEKKAAVQITEITESLLEACRKFNIPATRDIMNTLLQTILFLRKICNNDAMVQDAKFQGEVEQHLIGIKQLCEGIMLDVKQLVRSPKNKIGEILLEDGAIQVQDIDEVLKKQSSIYREMKFGEIAVREKKVGAGELIKAIRAQKIRNESGDPSVKIPMKRLDQMMDIAKQLSSTQNSLYHEAVLRFGNDDNFTAELKEAEGMLTHINEVLRGLSLVPLQQSFQKLTRAVRAMIEEAGIRIVFSTMGEDIEVKKELAEEVIIPLAEIIEIILLAFPSAQEEKQMGNIEMVAYQQKKQTVIEITSNYILSLEALMHQRKMDEIRAKIEKLQGSMHLERIENGDYKIQIIFRS